MTKNLCEAIEDEIRNLGEVYARRLKNWYEWAHDDFVRISLNGALLEVHSPFSSNPVQSINIESVLYFATVLQEFESLDEIVQRYKPLTQFKRITGYVLMLLYRVDGLSSELRQQVEQDRLLSPLELKKHKRAFFTRRFNLIYLAGWFISLASKLAATYDSDATSFQPSNEQTIEVLIATNRELQTSNEGFVNPGPPSNELSFARFNIYIPHRHERGNIERPGVVLKSKLFKAYIDPSKYFQITAGELISQQEFFDVLKAQSPSNSCFLYIHGYRNSMNASILKGAQLKVDLSLKMPVISFVWPSHDKLIAYAGDTEEAHEAALPLANLIKELYRKGIENIFVLAHSKGAYVVAQSLKYFENENVAIKRVLLAAADVDQRRFKEQHCDALLELTNNPILQVSKTDHALRSSEKANDGPRVGDASNEAFVVRGCETVDMSSCRSLFWSDFSGHGYTTKYHKALDELQSSLVLGLPPEKRKLEKLTATPNGCHYWRLP